MPTANKRKSALEIERELSEATDAYLRGEIGLEDLIRREEAYRALRTPNRKAHSRAPDAAHAGDKPPFAADRLHFV